MKPTAATPNILPAWYLTRHLIRRLSRPPAPVAFCVCAGGSFIIYFCPRVAPCLLVLDCNSTLDIVVACLRVSSLPRSFCLVGFCASLSVQNFHSVLDKINAKVMATVQNNLKNFLVKNTVKRCCNLKLIEPSFTYILL